MHVIFLSAEKYECFSRRENPALIINTFDSVLGVRRGIYAIIDVF